MHERAIPKILQYQRVFEGTSHQFVATGAQRGLYPTKKHPQIEGSSTVLSSFEDTTRDGTLKSQQEIIGHVFGYFHQFCKAEASGIINKVAQDMIEGTPVSQDMVPSYSQVLMLSLYTLNAQWLLQNPVVVPVWAEISNIGLIDGMTSMLHHAVLYKDGNYHKVMQKNRIYYRQHTKNSFTYEVHCPAHRSTKTLADAIYTHIEKFLPEDHMTAGTICFPVEEFKKFISNLSTELMAQVSDYWLQHPQASLDEIDSMTTEALSVLFQIEVKRALRTLQQPKIVQAVSEDTKQWLTLHHLNAINYALGDGNPLYIID